MHSNDRSRQLPIAETFHSLQGEGMWAGTPMFFIRLAGCSVGENPLHLPPQELEPVLGSNPLPILKTDEPAWLCHTYDGRPFWCDTDFGLRDWSSFDELLDHVWENHICLTGGEPLVHEDKLHPFIEEAVQRNVMVHVETSGTREVRFDPHAAVWVSVSPKLDYKQAMIDLADEVKLLVDQSFDLERVPHGIREHGCVFVQPVNDELMVRRDNFDKCMEILRIMPHWRLSIQLHKFLNVR